MSVSGACRGHVMEGVMTQARDCHPNFMGTSGPWPSSRKPAQDTLQYVWRMKWLDTHCGATTGPQMVSVQEDINVLFFAEATALTAREQVEGQEASQDQTVLG